MIQLYDSESGARVGSIGEDQLQFLIDQLEEESLEDRDYYLTAETLEFLEERGADGSLLALLRRALGKREGVEVRWSRE